MRSERSSRGPFEEDEETSSSSSVKSDEEHMEDNEQDDESSSKNVSVSNIDLETPSTMFSSSPVLLESS